MRHPLYDPEKTKVVDTDTPLHLKNAWQASYAEAKEHANTLISAMQNSVREAVDRHGKKYEKPTRPKALARAIREAKANVRRALENEGRIVDAMKITPAFWRMVANKGFGAAEAVFFDGKEMPETGKMRNAEDVQAKAQKPEMVVRETVLLQWPYRFSPNTANFMAKLQNGDRLIIDGDEVVFDSYDEGDGSFMVVKDDILTSVAFEDIAWMEKL